MQSLAAEVVLLSISFSSYILRCLFSASDVPFFWLPVPIDISEDILSVFFGFDAPQPAATSKKYAEIPMLAAMERKCGMPRLQWYGRKVGKFCQSTQKKLQTQKASAGTKEHFLEISCLQDSFRRYTNSVAFIYFIFKQRTRMQPICSCAKEAT